MHCVPRYERRDEENNSKSSARFVSPSATLLGGRSNLYGLNDAFRFPASPRHLKKSFLVHFLHAIFSRPIRTSNRIVASGENSTSLFNRPIRTSNRREAPGGSWKISNRPTRSSDQIVVSGEERTRVVVPLTTHQSPSDWGTAQPVY